MRKHCPSLEGYTLVETLVGVGVMALVITGGLVALGQATLLSEKSSDQVMADFLLRNEVEAIRASDWTTVSSHHDTISNYLGSNSSKLGYPSLKTLEEDALADKGYSAEVTSARLNSAGETGKIIFRVLVKWEDRTGRPHEEARAMVVTEGGLSAEL